MPANNARTDAARLAEVVLARLEDRSQAKDDVEVTQPVPVAGAGRHPATSPASCCGCWRCIRCCGSATIVSESQAGELGRGDVSASRGRLSRTALRPRGPSSPARSPRSRRLAVFSAAPHGASAPLVDEILTHAEAAADARGGGRPLRRLPLLRRGRYEAIYGHPHGAPARLAEFLCALPEHAGGAAPRHVAHPGCFTTAVTLAAVPLVGQGSIEPDLHASAVTGSTGSRPHARPPARTIPSGARTSSPTRRSPTATQPEMRRLVGAAPAAPGRGSHFVPHSGPFARGIYATLQARLARPADDRGARAPRSSTSTPPRRSSRSCRSRRACRTSSAPTAVASRRRGLRRRRGGVLGPRQSGEGRRRRRRSSG